MDIQKYVLWVILLPMCYAITEELFMIGGLENLNNILTKKINIDGRKVTLREIYGDVQFTKDNFKPGVRFTETLLNNHADTGIEIKDLEINEPPGGVYIERRFSLPSPSRIQWDIDTPVAIAAQLAEDIKNSQINSVPIILITGDVNVGKTAALDKIRRELVKSLPSIWTVTIDFTIIAPLSADSDHLTLDYIIDKSIPADCRELFRNILEMNPRKIIFMFDNLSEMGEIDGRVSRAVSLIRELVDKGTTVLTTGRYYTEGILMKEKLNMDAYKIPQWNIINAEDFLRSVWKKQITHQRPATAAPSSISNIDERLDDYVSAFTHALCKTSVPLLPSSILVLTEVFQHSISRYSRYPVSCFDYVMQSEESLSPMLLHTIENTVLEKYSLYEEFISRIQANRPNIFVNYYNAIAMSQIINNDKLPFVISLDLLNTITTATQPLLQLFKEKAFFTKVIGKSLEFIDSEYQNFFASQYLFSVDYEYDTLEDVEVLRRIVMEPEYKNVMEFLDPQSNMLNFNEIKPILFHKNKLIPRVLDNVIANGYESFFLHILKIFADENQLHHLRQYFAEMRSIKYASKRVLGMIASTKPHPDLGYANEIPDKKGTALELLVENNMFRVCQELHQHSITLGRDENWQNILRIAVTKPVPNSDFVQLLITKIIPSSVRFDYADLIYHAINEVGEESIPVAEFLFKYVVNPSAVMKSRPMLHAAVQWSSIELLKFVIEKLRVPAIDSVDNSGRTVFVAALDANPSPFHTVSGWWEMMSYLSQNIDRLSLPNRGQIEKLNFKISPSDLKSSWLKHIFSVDNILGNVKNNNVQSIKGSPVARHVSTRHSKLAQFIPPRYWRLEPQTLALRRNILLRELYKHDSAIHPIQVLANYRGTDILSSMEQRYYEKTIQSLYELNKNFLTMTVKARILQTVISNVCETRNTADLKYLKNSELFRNLKYKRRLNVLKILRTLLNDDTAEGSIQTESVSLQSRMLTSRLLELPELQVSEKDFNYGKISTNSDDSELRHSLLKCLSHIKPRDIISSSNCLFSWDDIDDFNDAPLDQRRIVSRIQVNAGRFLNTLAAIEYNNPDKGKQLVSLVRHLDKSVVKMPVLAEPNMPNMLLHEVLKEGSLKVHRHNQRVADTINFWQSATSSRKFRFPFRMPSSSLALYAAAGIPLIRGIYGTVVTCLQQHNDSNDNCLFATTALTLSATLIPASFLAVKYTPWLMERVTITALELLPSAAPISIVRDNLKFLRLQGLKYGGQTAAMAIGILGLGFDVYNIVQMSNMIDACNRDGTTCVSKDKIHYIISLSFSCVSIAATAGLIISGAGFAAGVLVGLALLAIETFALGISDVVHYSNRYDTTANENFRIFFHKIAFQPPPADVQELARRTDWVKILQQHAVELFQSNVNLIAYGVGIGTVTSSGAAPGYGHIDMNNDSEENTKDLSRVLPTPAGENTTLLCLPKQNRTQIFDTIAKEVKSAVYKCLNTFVIAHDERWRRRGNNNKSSIIYDLNYIESGAIIGSDNANNIFLINSSMSSLNIYGGGGNFSNTYMIRTDLFSGSISLSTESRVDILDLSEVQSPMLNLTWAINTRIGRVQFHNNNTFKVVLWPVASLGNTVRVIGREKLSDTLNCNYSISLTVDVNKQIISVDSRGGQSSSHVDYVDDCKVSVVRPFTRISGSENVQVTYTTLVLLDDESSSAITDDPQVAIIRPLRSKFIVMFANRPLFASSSSVTYVRSNGTLQWQLHYFGSSSLLLSIEPFLSSQLTKDINAETINCILIDTYSGSTVFPEIDLSSNDDITLVRSFNLFATVNASRFEDIYNYYINVISFSDGNMIIRCKVTNAITGQTYTLGSSENDRLYIDANSSYLFGGNGHDIYTLNSNSSKQIWIDNEAEDDVMDTLIIPDTTCDILEATLGSSEMTSAPDINTPFDVTLSCFVWSDPKPIEVILRNYLLGSHQRHLQIYWKGNTFVPLPPYWLDNIQNSTDDNSSRDIHLPLFFSLGEEWQFTALTLTSRDTLLVLNIGDSSNPLVAYRSEPRDIVLVKQCIDRHSSSFVVLQDFFSSDNSSEFSVDWRQLRIFIINNSIDNQVPSVMDANDVLKLYSSSSSETKMGRNVDFIQEYFVNMTQKRDDMIIEHNYKTKKSGGDRLSVLVVFGAEPQDFEAKWNYTDDSLDLCTRQSCIIVKKWCNSVRHRLHRIEFIQSINEPIVIRGLDHLACPKKAIYSDDNSFIKILNKKLNEAQKQLSLQTAESNDSDRSRLFKCVGSIFADIVARKSMYKLFGFSSMVQQTKFMRDNCQILITKRSVKVLILEEMKTMIENKIKLLKLDKSMLRHDEIQSIALVSERFQQLDDDCWQTFLSSLSNSNSNEKSSSILYECLQ